MVKRQVICEADWVEILTVEVPEDATDAQVLMTLANEIISKDWSHLENPNTVLENLSTPNPRLVILDGTDPVCWLTIPMEV